MTFQNNGCGGGHVCTCREIPWGKGTPTNEKVLAEGLPECGQAESPAVRKGRPWGVSLRNVAFVL